MRLHRIAAFSAMLIAAGCSAHGASGTYIARGQGFVQMLQITQAQDGQLLGSLSSATLNPNGSITQDTTNIAGVAAGHAVTLVAKSPIPLFPSVNLPGTFEGGAITITNPNGQERFTSGSPGDYQIAVQQLQAQGSAIRERKRLADEDASVAALNKKLTDYAALVRQPQADQQLATFHAVHTKALERARHGLEIQQKYPKGSLQASQVDLAIIQIQVQLQGYDINWDGVPERGRTHVHQFDTDIGQSVCRTNPALDNCTKQPAAVQAYQTVRAIVLRRSDDIETTLKKDEAAMKAIVEQAGTYSND